MTELGDREEKNPSRGTTPLALEKEFGPDFEIHSELLAGMWDNTGGMTAEEQNEHFRVAKKEVIPLINRCNEVSSLEEQDAFALFEKYHKKDTGVRDMLFKEYNTMVQDLETRLPGLAKAVKAANEKLVTDTFHTATFGSSKHGLFIIFHNDTRSDESQLQMQGYKAMSNLMVKRVALMKDQDRVLTRALEENGIQLPPEYVSIRQQLEEHKWYNSDEASLGITAKDVTPELQSETTQPDHTGETQDASPDVRVVSLSEDLGSSTHVAHWDKQREPRIGEAENTPPREMAKMETVGAKETSQREMTKAELQHLLKSMRGSNCCNFFEIPLSEEESPEYFDMVREGRDLATMKEDLSQDPQYGALEFFRDIRVMLDNYSHVFREGSREHTMTELFEQMMLKKLEGYGEAGQTAKAQFDSAPRAKFNDTIPLPEADETIQLSEADDGHDSFSDEDDFETSFAQGIHRGHHNNSDEERDDSFFGKNGDIINYEEDRGHFPQTPGTVGPARKFGSQGGFVDQSPSVPDPADQSLDGDELIKRAWGGRDEAEQWNQAHGLPTRAPAGRGRAQTQNDSPSCAASDTAAQSGNQDDQGPGGRPSPDINKPAEQPEEFSSVNPYSSAPVASGPAEQNDDKDSDILSSIASLTPSPVAKSAAEAGEPGDEGAHASAHTLEQSAPVASMHVEQEIIDLTASPPPPRQTSNVDSTSTKRARVSDDQDSSSDDDAPLIKRRKTTAEPSSEEAPLSSKRQKAAAEPTGYAVTSSLGKRSRDDDDDNDDEEERGPPSKRNKASAVPEPQAPVSAAAGDDGLEHTSLTINELFEPFELPPPSVQETPPPMATAAAQYHEPSLADYKNLSRRVQILTNQQDAQLPPSPIPEPLTPPAAATGGPGSVSPPPMLDGTETGEPANNVSGNEGHESRPASSSPIAAAEEPQPEPATEDLGHTGNGTITASRLQKFSKYKKKRGSTGRGRPSRPWVFGYRFGNDYGLYIMSCPKKGCETGVEVFTTHPLMRNDAANHLQECGYEFANDDDMVRKYGTQVISDDKKTVSIEWARNWNNELMKEYGNEELEEDNF